MSTYATTVIPADLAEFLTGTYLNDPAVIGKLLDDGRVVFTFDQLERLAEFDPDSQDGFVDIDPENGLHRIWVGGTEYEVFPEQVTLDQAAVLLSAPNKPVNGGDTAGKILRGLNLAPASRQLGRSGQNLWDREEVVRAIAGTVA